MPRCKEILRILRQGPFPRNAETVRAPPAHQGERGVGDADQHSGAGKVAHWQINIADEIKWIMEQVNGLISRKMEHSGAGKVAQEARFGDIADELRPSSRRDLPPSGTRRRSDAAASCGHTVAL